MEMLEVPTKEMPKLPKMPYRIYCSVCKVRTIVASDEPIPEAIMKLKGTPCSECVAPDVYRASRMKND